MRIAAAREWASLESASARSGCSFSSCIIRFTENSARDLLFGRVELFLGFGATNVNGREGERIGETTSAGEFPANCGDGRGAGLPEFRRKNMNAAIGRVEKFFVPRK